MTKANIESFFVSPETSIRDTMVVIDKGSAQIALVIDVNQKLLGTVTDGDIRRAILRGVDLNATIKEAMNTNFHSLPLSTRRKDIEVFLKLSRFNQIPLIDEEGIVRDLVTLRDFMPQTKRPNYVVLMVGGLGTRLFPLTEKTPKPLLHVGGRPILEIIIRQFQSSGFYNFILCVNYKSEQIIQYFGDGSKYNVNIEYIKENQRLGTAGALSLIKKRFAEPLIVMNGDLLTQLHFKQMLDYHVEGNYSMTIGSTSYEYTVPYGVLQVNGHEVTEIVEKPTQRFFINGGFYVLNPQVIKEIPYNTYYDMTDLITHLLNQGNKVGCFPSREFWLDIGRPADYQRANEEYWSYFSEQEVAATTEEDQF